jgi:hypothetical protein
MLKKIMVTSPILILFLFSILCLPLTQITEAEAQWNKKGLRTPIQKLPVPKIQKRDLNKTDPRAQWLRNGNRTPIQKLPVPKIQKRDLHKTDTGAGKVAKHKRDIISGKFDNPTLDQLFAIIGEQFLYEQSLADGSTFGLSPGGSNDPSVPFYDMLCWGPHIEGLDDLGRYIHATFQMNDLFECGTTSQLSQCGVDNHREEYTDRSTGERRNRGRDISIDLVLGGTSLAKCFCKFASRLDPRATVDFRSTHNDDSPIDIPPIYEGVCADIFAQ